MRKLVSYYTLDSVLKTIITMHAVTRFPFRLTPLEVREEERDSFILFVALKGGA